MNFFQQIYDLADGVDLSIKIKRKNGKLTVSVLPGNSASVMPLNVTATPEELDQNIEKLFVSPLLEVKHLVSNEASFKKSVQERSAKTEPTEKKGATTGKAEKPVKEKKLPKAKKVKTDAPASAIVTKEEEQPVDQRKFF